MKTKKYLALVLAMMMFASLLTGCGGGGASDEDTTAVDTLVVYSSGAFQGSWDPSKNSILSNKHLEYNTYDSLLNYDVAGEMTPNMAESWEYLEDGYTLRIYLNEGIKFHDGSDCNAEDVAASLVYLSRKDSSLHGDFGTTLEAAVVDDYTVDVWPTGKVASASLLTLLAHEAILSADDIAAGTLDNTMNGTGPYKMVKYENETCYLEAFADYWNPERAAKIPYAEYKYVAESSTRMAALQAGEAHVIERVDIEQVPILEADDAVVVDKVPSEEQRYIVFKTTQGPMGDELLRRAMAHAIDRETIVNDILQGYGYLANSYMPHVSNLYEPIDYMLEYDVEKAKELLAEAGYPNGEGLPTIEYISSTGLYPKSKEIAEFVASSWEAIGIDVNLTVEETAAWESHLYMEDSCLVTDTGWMNMHGDSNAYISVHYLTRGRVNFSSYADIDEILARESQETDPVARKAIVTNELLPRLVETCSNFPMYDSMMVYARGANVSGVEYLPNSNFRFADISFE